MSGETKIIRNRLHHEWFMQRPVQYENGIPVDDLMVPRAGKAIEICFNHDKPVTTFTARCMDGFCKRTEAMSIISGEGRPKGQTEI